MCGPLTDSVAFLGGRSHSGLPLLRIDGAGSFPDPGHDEEEASHEADGGQDQQELGRRRHEAIKERSGEHTLDPLLKSEHEWLKQESRG